MLNVFNCCYCLVQESMKEKIEQIKARKKESQLLEVLNDFEINEVYASVLGKENRGGARGFGIGFRPEQVPGMLVEKRGIHLEVQALREQHEAEIEKIRMESQDKEDKLREEMNEQTVATTEKLKNMESGMKKQEVLLARLFGAYDSSEMLAAAITRNGVSLQPPMVHIQPSIEHNMDDVYRPHFCEGLLQQVS